jgi:sortase A
VGLHVVVIQGSTASDTVKGPGLITGTARPGTIGNAVIIGRATTAGAPFGKLKDLKPGAKVLLSSGLGKFYYVITKTAIARPGEKSPASPVNHAQLTLITADSPLSNSNLYYVVARQTTAPGADAKPKVKPPLNALGTVGDTSRLIPAIILGLLYVICIVGTVVAYRRRREQAIAIYVLTTPIILAVALLWFQNLYLLLPSSF